MVAPRCSLIYSLMITIAAGAARIGASHREPTPAGEGAPAAATGATAATTTQPAATPAAAQAPGGGGFDARGRAREPAATGAGRARARVRTSAAVGASAGGDAVAVAMAAMLAYAAAPWCGDSMYRSRVFIPWNLAWVLPSVAGGFSPSFSLPLCRHDLCSDWHAIHHRPVHRRPIPQQQQQSWWYQS